RLEREHRDHVAPHIGGHRPRREDRHREQERGQQDEPQADPVHADDPLQPDARHPRRLFDQLEAGVAVIEPPEHRDRQSEGHQRDEQRQPPSGRVAPLPAAHHDREHTEQREEDQDAQQVPAHPRTPMNPSTSTAPKNRTRAYVRTNPVWRSLPSEAERLTSPPMPFTAPSTTSASNTSEVSRASAWAGWTITTSYARSTYQPRWAAVAIGS